jgi:propionyl-CoA:succinyl-CoA transferase
MSFPHLTPEEAAAFIHNGQFVGFSGFTPAGAAKLVPRALAARAKAEHAAGRPFRVRVMTGASTGDLDDLLAEAEAVSWRAPYQSSARLRKQINEGTVEFVDMHLSHVPQALLFGFFGDIDVAVVEASDVTADGRVYLTTSIGATPTMLHWAKKIVIEINRRHSPRLREMTDITMLPPPPHRLPIPILDPLAKIGVPYIQVEPGKILGVIEHEAPDGVHPFAPPDRASQAIADQVVEFLLAELRSGRIPPEFLPLQAGVGNVANAVMARLGAHKDIPNFVMFTEVFQDSLVDLMLEGRLVGASSTALTLTEPQLQRIYDNFDFFGPRVVLRPQEISNNPGVIRRFGVITMNTALEVDIYGHANSTHVAGTNMMNGIGGSGDFTRNSYLSIFMCPSVAKGGRISSIVPMASHVDHNEHSVQVVVTDQGLADLRGLGPIERARRIIDNCAHPAYRPYLHAYIERSRPGHIRHDLATCFDLHRNLLDRGQMLPDLDLSQFAD